MGLIPTSGVPEEGRMLGPPGKQDNVQRCLKLSDTYPGLELLTSSLRIHQKNNPKLDFERRRMELERRRRCSAEVCV